MARRPSTHTNTRGLVVAQAKHAPVEAGVDLHDVEVVKAVHLARVLVELLPERVAAAARVGVGARGR